MKGCPSRVSWQCVQVSTWHKNKSPMVSNLCGKKEPPWFGEEAHFKQSFRKLLPSILNFSLLPQCILHVSFFMPLLHPNLAPCHIAIFVLDISKAFSCVHLNTFINVLLLVCPCRLPSFSSLLSRDLSLMSPLSRAHGPHHTDRLLWVLRRLFIKGSVVFYWSSRGQSSVSGGACMMILCKNHMLFVVPICLIEEESSLGLSLVRFTETN